MARTGYTVFVCGATVSKVNDERATLEAQHEVTRASLARADSVLQATAASLIDLRNAAKGMDVNVRQLQSGFAETNKVLSERLSCRKSSHGRSSFQLHTVEDPTQVSSQHI